MRKKLDPRLRYLLSTVAATESKVAEESFSVTAAPPPAIEVLVRCSATVALEDLKLAGLQIHAETRGVHTVVAGVIELAALPNLSSLSAVQEVEFPRVLQADLDLSRTSTVTRR